MLLIALPTLLLFVQQTGMPSNAPPQILRASPEVHIPKLLVQTQPRYSRAALRARVQGNCLLDIIIDENGVPTNIKVLSPIGFGLDENAERAVSTWRFVPPTDDGRPVRIEATVQINFRMPGRYFDVKAETRKTEFALLESRLEKQPGNKPDDKQKSLVEDLVREKYVPAEYLLGMWDVQGEFIPKNESEGLALLTDAVDKDYAPAMFFLGNLALTGRAPGKSPEEGLQLIKDAAVAGSRPAQLMLGKKYEAGEGVEQDRDRATRYYRLCASTGDADCELRLAKLLLSAPNKADPDQNLLEAIAWLELAADHGSGEARALASSESSNLSDAQVKWIERLKGQLEQQSRFLAQ